jgi:murein DD-endopeptidase MepM/ murein hydrolase activator NlpD
LRQTQSCTEDKYFKKVVVVLKRKRQSGDEARALELDFATEKRRNKEEEKNASKDSPDNIEAFTAGKQAEPGHGPESNAEPGSEPGLGFEPGFKPGPESNSNSEPGFKSGSELGSEPGLKPGQAVLDLPPLDLPPLDQSPLDQPVGESGGEKAAIEETPETAAFAAVAAKLEKAIPANEGRLSSPLPKASGSFPFAAKERPLRKQTNLQSWLSALKPGKAWLVNSGPILVLGFLVFSMVFVQIHKPFLMMINGKPIAYVQKQEDGQKLLEQASLELSSPYPAEANFRQKAEISYTQEGVPIKTKVTDDQAILASLKTDITWLVDGWSIIVGNESTVFLPSRSEAEAVLESIKKSYLPDDDSVSVLSVEFVQPYDIVQEEISITSLGSSEQALRTLTEGREPLREYRVQSGDSFWSIANKHQLTVEGLKEINGITSNNLQVGQVLKLNSPQPLLSVKITSSAVNQEDIPYDTVYRLNENAWEGQSKVLTAGAIGTKEIQYEIAQINGVLVEKKVLSETIIAEPVSRVVENGAKTIVVSRAADVSGSGFAWPIRGRINSPFGPRGGGFHSGIDIQASIGDPVYSAAGGRVTAASYSSGYGNAVTIDHGDGLSTLYAHLSQMNVSVGQEVGVQELVGLAGNTGRTTGPHLHFEVRIDGSAVNPINYLN